MFIMNRLAGMVATVLIALTIVFVIGNFLGDPVRVMLGEDASREQVEALRESLGLDRPLALRYVEYLSNVASGDLGTSLRYRQSNTELVLSRLPFTFQLAGVATAIGILVGIPAGILAAWRKGGWWDRFTHGFTVLFQSVALFWLGLMLVLLFAVTLNWLPATGAGTWRHIVLPALTLSTYPIARITRLTRSSMIEALSKDYVSSARARGLNEFRVVTIHALKNAAAPIVTIIGLQAGVLLSGTVTVEFVFAWPGLGLLAVQAVNARDVTLVQAAVLAGVLSFVLINFAVDLMYGFIDPRTRQRGLRK